MSQVKLAEVGLPLLGNGYHVIPIKSGDKRPSIAKWQEVRATKSDLNRWLKQGHGDCGVGLLTVNTPAIDIDCMDDDVVDELVKWIQEEFNVSPPRRYGKRPKTLLLFKTQRSIKKLKSSVWSDLMFGDTHAVELLADGQQFVAYGNHKNTGKPYTWENGNPLEIDARDLPEITEQMARAIIEKFDEIASREGWEKKAASRVSYTGDVDSEQWVRDTLIPPLDVETDELRDVLLSIPDVDNYDTKCQLGMALYHQYGGDEAGFDLWCEWAEQSDKFNLKESKYHWGSFDHKGKRQLPLTARTIYKLAKDASKDATEKLLLDLTHLFTEAQDPEQWTSALERAQESELESGGRMQLENIARSQYRHVTMMAEIKRGVPAKQAKGTEISKSEIRKMLSYRPKKDKVPFWMKNWVYDDSSDQFVHLKTKITLTEKGFNANYDRHIKNVNDEFGSTFVSASELALKYHQIKVVNGIRYAPGAGEIFHDSGLVFANSYREDVIPTCPEQIAPRDKIAVSRVQAHLAHLFPDNRESRMFLDWLAYVVQNPGKRVNYAVLLQGTHGDGKSFFKCLLETVMGIQNVRSLKAKSLEGDFNGWAVGQCVTAIEEVRLVGKNRYTILNNLKDQITNDYIEVHAKGKDQYVSYNTTNYLLFTNYRDALPIDSNERRYLVLQSRFQSRTALEKFEDQNPDYYHKLYESLRLSPGGLRKWLLEHQLSSSFSPSHKAPRTLAGQQMIQQSTPEFVRVMEDIIKNQVSHGVTEEIIVSSYLRDAMMDYPDLEPPKTRAQSAMLARMEYTVSHRIKIDGRAETVYVKLGGRFMRGSIINNELVRSHLNEAEL